MRGDSYLVISDLQIPFDAPSSLKFTRLVQSHFKIPRDHVICVGDEVDQYWGGQWLKSPDARHTPNDELDETRDRLKEWYAAYPKLRLFVSNHGIRWAKKAFEAQIPSQLIKPWREVIGAPAGWQWRHRWDIDTAHPWSVIHGMGYSGVNGHRNAALDLGRSVAIGHLHGFGGVARVTTETQTLWGMNVGCLVEPDAYAFEYGRYSRNKPTLGLGVVLNDGKIPLFVPYEAI